MLKFQKLTQNSPPLHQLRPLGPLRPRKLQRRAPAVFPLESELVFRRELGHVWGPLAFGLVGVVFGEGVGVIVLV